MQFNRFRFDSQPAEQFSSQPSLQQAPPSSLTSRLQAVQDEFAEKKAFREQRAEQENSAAVLREQERQRQIRSEYEAQAETMRLQKEADDAAAEQLRREHQEKLAPRPERPSLSSNPDFHLALAKDNQIKRRQYRAKQRERFRNDPLAMIFGNRDDLRDSTGESIWTE